MVPARQSHAAVAEITLIPMVANTPDVNRWTGSCVPIAHRSSGHPFDTCQGLMSAHPNDVTYRGMVGSPIDFVTFGGGRSMYRRSAERLGREASRSGLFREVTVVTDRDLPIDFHREHGDFVDRNRRGHGYWIWKPFLLERLLRQPSDAMLLYCDAGNVFNITERSKSTFTEYLEITESRGILVFEIDFIEAEWCKMDTLMRIDPSGAFWQTRAHEAATLFLTRGRESRAIIEEWLAISSEDSYHYLDDSPSVAENVADFREHRHDQSILSLLTKKAGIGGSADVLTPWNNPDAMTMPIWTARHRSGLRFRRHASVPYRMARKAERALDRLEEAGMSARSGISH